jgi:multicomponent Na+:H+ antiporter subunit E
MNLALLTLVLALGWSAATGSFSLPSLLFGALVGALCLYVIRAQVASPTLLPRARRILALAALFARELIMSELRVARLVLRPSMTSRLHPAIIAFPLTVTSDAEITLLANLITLTPGTLSLDVSDDRRFLYIHAIDVVDREAFIAELKDGFERHVLEVFQ